MYKILRSILFLFPTEWVHYFSMNWLKFICSIGFFRKALTNFFYPSGSTHSLQLFGLNFKNRIGLGAGFDKNARYLRELETLGFGYVEIGTVTPKAQQGNDKPRLFRLPKDKALINRMGFNNDGVVVIAQRLRIYNSRESGVGSREAKNNYRLIIGGNIGKNKSTPNEDAWKDYEICFRELFDCVDYFVVNVSSPNTPGLRELQEKESLRKILSNLTTINKSNSNPKPLLLKIAPDLTKEQIDDVIDLAIEIKLDGLVATNTTVARDGLQTPKEKLEKLGMGGLSGAPLKNRSSEIISYIHKRTNGKLPIIGSGGVFTKEDATEKFNEGAQLVQVWTGFIYEGPGIVKKILNRRTEESGVRSRESGVET